MCTFGAMLKVREHSFHVCFLHVKRRSGQDQNNADSIYLQSVGAVGLIVQPCVPAKGTRVRVGELKELERCILSTTRFSDSGLLPH